VILQNFIRQVLSEITETLNASPLHLRELAYLLKFKTYCWVPME
jgi:hypothetical protein